MFCLFVFVIVVVLFFAVHFVLFLIFMFVSFVVVVGLFLFCCFLLFFVCLFSYRFFTFDSQTIPVVHAPH